MTSPTPPTPGAVRKNKGSKMTMNMGIARAHEFATQLVGVQLAAANLLALAVSATSIVAGTVTYAVINQPGAWPIWIAAGAIGSGLAILIEGMTLSALIRIRLANKQIHAIITRMEAERDAALAKAEAAAGGKNGKVEGRWKFAGRKRYATRAYRKSRRYSMPLACIGALASATAGGLFYHTVLGSLGTYQSIGVSALFALIVTGTFVSSELFKEVQEEAVREGFRGGSLAEEAMREETYRATNQAVSQEVTEYLTGQEAKDAIRRAATHLLMNVLLELNHKASDRTGQATGHVTVTEDQAGHAPALPPTIGHRPTAIPTGQDRQQTTNNRTASHMTGQPDTTNATGQGSAQPANQTQPAAGDQDKLDRTIAYLKTRPQATDEELAARLGMSRPASALFYRRKAEELLTQQDQPADPAARSIRLDWIEQRMLGAITSATPEQQTEIRELAAAQSLAEFTHTLQQRYPTFASFITEERVAHVIAYDRQQQVGVSSASSVTGQAERSTLATGHEEEAAKPSEQDTDRKEEPANIIDIATGHRPPRTMEHGQPDKEQTGQTAPKQPKQPDTGQHEKAAKKPASGQPDTAARVAAYRTAHPDATQTQVAEALEVSERTARRHWKQEEVAG